MGGEEFVQKRMTYVLSLILISILVFADPNIQVATAQSSGDIDKKLNEIQEEEKKVKSKQSEIDGEKKKTEDKMSENKNQQSSVEEELTELQSELEKTEAEISEKEAEIAETNQEINRLDEEIEELNEEVNELQERIIEREELLKNRLRSLQDTGGQAKYIEVILGSQSFADFISRSTAVNTIMDQDKAILEEQADDKQMLETKQDETEDKKEEVEGQRVALEDQKSSLVALQGQLDEQQAEREVLMAQLEEEYEDLEETQLSLDEEQQILAAEADSIEKAKQLAQREKDELDQLAKQKSQESSSSSSSSSSGGSSSSVASSGGGGGTFAWPASGGMGPRSGFGPRVHPITGEVGKMHNGIDIQAGHGAAVSAAANGVVSTAGTMGGYGNTITITHHINGKTYTTLYAHLSSINVSAGQEVSRGQNIGAVGSTGNSTGPHLHFEVHVGGFGNPQNPLNYLN